jgi:hypothetical protein
VPRSGAKYVYRKQHDLLRAVVLPPVRHPFFANDNFTGMVLDGDAMMAILGVTLSLGAATFSV